MSTRWHKRNQKVQGRTGRPGFYEPEGREFESLRAHHSNLHRYRKLSCNLRLVFHFFSRYHRYHWGWNLKTSPKLLCYFAPEFHILRQHGVAVRYGLLGLSESESDEVFRSPLFSQQCCAEPTHTMKACLLRTDLCQDRMERTAKHRRRDIGLPAASVKTSPDSRSPIGAFSKLAKGVQRSTCL